MKLSTKAAVLKSVSLLVGGAKHVDWDVGTVINLYLNKLALGYLRYVIYSTFKLPQGKLNHCIFYVRLKLAWHSFIQAGTQYHFLSKNLNFLKYHFFQQYMQPGCVFGMVKIFKTKFKIAAVETKQ